MKRSDVQTHRGRRSAIRLPGSGVRALALLLLVVMGAGCAKPIGVRRVSNREADRRLAANVLATGEPSAWSRQTLHRNALLDLYREDRALALERLHATLAEPKLDTPRLRDRLFALSELSFDHARRIEDPGLLRRAGDPRPWLLASAVYALGFVTLDEGGSLDAVALDSRTRLAADLYSRALSDGLERDGVVAIEDGEHALPFGQLSLDLDESTLRWGSFRLDDFVPSAELEPHGIANRYRHAGIGAPLAASAIPTGDADVGRVGLRARVATTLLMYLDFSVEALLAGELNGRLALYPADVSREVEIDGRPVPLEVDSTAALALRLDRFRTRAELTRSFLSGDISAITSDRFTDQLAMFTPYRPQRIPVVFVHGTYSDPSTWAEMLNELENDPVLSGRLQYWFFFYASGSPIGYSGGMLAEALRGIVRELDPAAQDAALRQMVMIGHSQGGLLTKLSVIDSGLRFWNDFFDRLPEELEVSDDTRRILVRSLVFEPVEPVSRVVFISTPHGGSFLTRGRLASAVAGLISIPSGLTDRVTDLLQNEPDAVALQSLEDLPTSLDNMRPGDPFLEGLRQLDVAEDVAVHSIVAVRGEGPRERLSDGVVQYVSAHIQQGSERLVQSGHSSHRHPDTIAEVRRILREHLASLPDPAR